MADIRTFKWLLLLLCMLITVETEALYVPITYLTKAVKQGAVCLDGSPPAYHIHRGFGSGINSWMVHLQGGGWCHNVSNCLQRSTNHLGSSKKMEKLIPFSAILNNQRAANPHFYNWNRVAVRYCDGSSFTGDVQRVDPATHLHFRGERIWIAIMEELLSLGMDKAENALLTGGSAGGLAAILHCDSFSALLPMGANVKCLPDGGYFINEKDMSGQPHIQTYFKKIVTLHGSVKNLPPSCTSRIHPTLCFFPQYVVQHIETPLFVVNAAYDSWQIKNVLAPTESDPFGLWRYCKTNISLCFPTQIEKLQDFRQKFIDALVGVRTSPANGMFINSCFAHTQTVTQKIWFDPTSPVLSNSTISAAVGNWFYDRRPFRKIDCPYPCDSTCHNTIYKTQQLFE